MRTTPPSLALFWDESHLWGVLLRRALLAMNAPVTMLKAEHIRAGALDALAPDILLAPGGWARLKALALGQDGRDAIRAFVNAGGTYVGFCGGAGLALASENRTQFLDLCSWSRKPASQRLPNFSGHLTCRIDDQDADQTAELPVWWPSQFAPDPETPLDVLARYENPGSDFWSADLDWSGVAPGEIGQWEELYGINLDPERLRGEPCIVRGRHGQGAFILSYAHLETPDSPQANHLLARLLGLTPRAVPAWDLSHERPLWDDPSLEQIQDALSGLIRFGQSHFLLFWRTPWLLGWRRGVPGSPLTFLHAMVWQARHCAPSDQAGAFWADHGPHCRRLCEKFCAQVRTYLLLERRILATAPSSPETSASPGLQRRKLELFGKFPGYGGIYGDILRALDELLWLQFSAPNVDPDQP
jgi:hypothetical protein